MASAFFFIKPTWRNYIMYVDLEAREGNELAQKVLRVYQSLPTKERLSAMPEQICDLAGIPPGDLFSIVSRQAWTTHSVRANMALSFLKNDVVEKSAEFACAAPENYKHAEMIMKASGLLPVGPARSGTPNVTVPIFQNFGGQLSPSNGGAGGVKQLTASQLDSGELPEMDAEITSLSAVLQASGIAEAAAARAPKHQAAPEPPDDEDDEDDGEDDR